MFGAVIHIRHFWEDEIFILNHIERRLTSVQLTAAWGRGC